MGFDFLIDNQFVERYSQEVPLEPELLIFRLWASSELPFGEHTIDVEVEELQNAAAVIDYFQVFSSGGTRAASTSSQTQTFATVLSTASPAATTSSRTVTSFPTESSSEASSSGKVNKAPIGPIVGGGIGGILVILLLVLAAIWLRKRRLRLQFGGSEATSYEETINPLALSLTSHSATAHGPVLATQSSSTPLFALPQIKTRPQENTNGTPTTSPVLTRPQPKGRPSANNSHNPFQSPTSSNLSPSILNANSTSSQAGALPVNSGSPRNAVPSDDSLQVVEAIRTLQTYLQRQPDGLGQVAQGLGMNTADDVDTLNPPPAYEESH